MRYFWLVASIIMFIGITYFGLKEGFENWWYNYIFVAIALLEIQSKAFPRLKVFAAVASISP